MIVCGVDYPVVKTVKSEKIGKALPVLDIPMMSDEKWQELANTPEQLAHRKRIAKQKKPLIIR